MDTIATKRKTTTSPVAKGPSTSRAKPLPDYWANDLIELEALERWMGKDDPEPDKAMLED